MLQGKTKVTLYSDRNINSRNYRNWKWKITGIAQNGQKFLIFIAVAQLRIPDETGFVKKKSKITLKMVIIIMII